jgi:hypothetical protein
MIANRSRGSADPAIIIIVVEETFIGYYNESSTLGSLREEQDVRKVPWSGAICATELVDSWGGPVRWGCNVIA